MQRYTTVIIALLLIIIVVLAWFLISKPVEAPTVPVATTTTSTTDGSSTTGQVKQPLHEKIVVTYPKAGASVPKKFTVTGKAPGNWFFEASAPVMVRTPDGDKVFQGTAQTIGDWMTTDLVDFKADVQINPAYSGEATLILLKDNPSGLPENEDSLEIPIVVE